MLSEFKKFALRGNVVDMAVGIIIGAAFGAIVNSMVKDILMPPIGLLLGNVDFSNLFITLQEGAVKGPYPSLKAAAEAGAVTLNIGLFLNQVISFLIVAFCVFLLVRSMNKLRTLTEKEKGEPAQEPTTKECPFCFETISIKAKRCPKCTSVLD